MKRKRDILLLISGIFIGILICLLFVSLNSCGDVPDDESQFNQGTEDSQLFNSVLDNASRYRAKITDIRGKLNQEVETLKDKYNYAQRRYNILTNVKELPDDHADCKNALRSMQSYQSRIKKAEEQITQLSDLLLQLDDLKIDLNNKERPIITDNEQDVILRAQTMVDIYDADAGLIPLEETGE